MSRTTSAPKIPKGKNTVVYRGEELKFGKLSWKPAGVVVAVFVVIGVIYLLIRSFAATSSLPDPLYNGGQAPWNQPIGTNPILDSNSTTMVNAVDSRVNPTMNAFGMPLYTSTASDPTYTVKCVLGSGGCDSLFDSKQPIHIPSNAAASTGDDHWLFVYDTTKNQIFEMWEASKSGSTWSYNTGNVYSPTSDGVLQVDGSVQDGNGSSYFAGVVSAADWNRGYINHALSLASQATVANQGRYPMNSSTDGGSGSGHVVPMGARFYLDSSVNCDGLGASKIETMVCHAMQIYGAYMHDTGGVPLSIYFQENNSAGGIWSAQGWNENMTFSKIPWSKMHVLKSWNSYTVATTSITSFTAASTSIAYNTGTTLSWATQAATSCSISPTIGTVGTSGSQSTGNLTSTTTYTLSCSGSNGNPTKQLTVTVAAAPNPTSISSFTASPTSVSYNTGTTLSWATQAATSCSISPTIGSVATSGSRSTGNLTATTTYTLSCTGNGSPTKQLTVSVGAPPSSTSISSFTAAATSIAYNTSTTLSWATQSASTCSISPSIGSVVVNGSHSTGNLTSTTAYTLSCAGNGSPTKQATITVGAAPSPTPSPSPSPAPGPGTSSGGSTTSSGGSSSTGGSTTGSSTTTAGAGTTPSTDPKQQCLDQNGTWFDTARLVHGQLEQCVTNTQATASTATQTSSTSQIVGTIKNVSFGIMVVSAVGILSGCLVFFAAHRNANLLLMQRGIVATGAAAGLLIIGGIVYLATTIFAK